MGVVVYVFLVFLCCNTPMLLYHHLCYCSVVPPPLPLHFHIITHLPSLFPQNPPDWQEILTYFRGSDLQNYFTRVLEDDIKAIIKPQYVDHIPKAVR